MTHDTRHRRFIRHALAVFVPLGLAACSMQPTYERPAQPVPNQYPSGPAYDGKVQPTTPGVAAADLGWQDFFTDPKLRRLIELAIQNNRDLRVATLSIDQARAQYRVQRAAQFPSLSANAGLVSSRLPPDLRGAGLPSQLNTFTAGVGLNDFEIDLFGRVRSLKDAALEQYLAITEVRRATQISLVAEVASTYLTLQADQALLKISQDTLNVQQQSVEMMKRGKMAGGMAQLDVHRAQTQYEVARVGVEQFTRQVAQDQNALAVLLGMPVPPDLLPPQTFDTDTAVAELPAGLPSALLEQRPDIMAAEHRLKAANANIGAARAAFFPHISLTAAVGVASTALAGLFTSGVAWTLAPQVAVPLFNGGANQGNLDVAKTGKDINIAMYERTVQQAFREVSDGLAARGTYDREEDAGRAQLHEIEETKRLSEIRFRNGVDDYFPVFDAQRQLYTTEQSLVTIRLARLTSRVALYKALGGGWSRETATAQAGDSTTSSSSAPSPIQTQPVSQP